MYQHGMVFQSAPENAPLVSSIGPNFYGFSQDDPKFCPITLTTACKNVVREQKTVRAAENRTQVVIIHTVVAD